jgi:hypothetical protein
MAQLQHQAADATRDIRTQSIGSIRRRHARQ